MDEKELQKKVKAGAILAQVSFEVIGNPREHVEKTIKSFINNIRNDSQIKILSEEYGEAEEVKDSKGLWSTYADTEMLFDKPDKLVWLCINFMPASIDIISPEELKFKDKDFTNWLNDLLAKLHEVATGVRDSNVKDEIITKNMNALIQNAIIIASEHYHKPEQISEKVGVDVKQLQPFFDALVKQNKLEKKDDGYYHKVRHDGAKKRD